MIRPEGLGVCRDPLSTHLLDETDGTLCLTIGFAISHRNVMMSYGKTFAQLGKASLVFSSIISADPSGFPPTCNDIVQELSGSPAMQRWDRQGFDPLGKWIHGYKQVLVPY